MKVELVAYTPDPQRVVASSVQACHGKTIKSGETLKDEDIRRLIEMVKTSGHHSVMEHASFTFAVSGVSRVLTHQLVRHRIASYSQQSQRYVNLRGGGYVTPRSLKEGDAKEVFKSHVESSLRAYQQLLDMGIAKEDARYVLPNAAKTNIVITMNARALWNFFSLRTCRRAQDEIRQLALNMLTEVYRIAPVLFEDAGAPCVRGPCPEGKYSCKKPMKKGDFC
ncbi:MAG TPA: FAD-dependent thymidylate synthase [Euryarchaeota archaeon]|nr:FAD-dependent thymidylate synthase [Euryarchaeota archaeon]